MSQPSPHQAAIQVAVRIHKTLHGGGPLQPPIREMAQGNCRAVDIGEYRFITQNPTKRGDDGQLTKSAQQARDGRQITWVIHQPSHAFIAVVQDNQLRELKNRNQGR